MTARVRINVPAAYQVAGQDAYVFVERVLQEMLFLARIQASAGPYSTGELAASLELQGPVLRTPYVRGAIGSRLNYALAVHDGARQHDIFPKGAPHVYRFESRKRPQLKFYWRKEGRVAYFPHIPGSLSTVGRSHPGIRQARRFLADPLELVGRRYGFRVVVTDL